MPAAQDLHVEAPWDEKLPAAHVRQEVSLPSPKVPAAQAVHAEFDQWVPLPQHTVAPELVQ